MKNDLLSRAGHDNALLWSQLLGRQRQEHHGLRPAPENKLKEKRTGGMAQLVEHLLSKT
jgi:hypothetical protein